MYILFIYIFTSISVSAQAQEVAKSAQSHTYTALTAKRNALVEQLESKVKRYKELQVKEMVRYLMIALWLLLKKHTTYRIA